MDLAEIGDVQLAYRSLEIIDFGPDGRAYGAMSGTLTGPRISGRLELTNLAPLRPDNVNLPTLRGLLTTQDGGRVWAEFDGIARLREADSARLFVTSARFRTGDERHAWLNYVVGIMEGVLDTSGDLPEARGRLFECRQTLT